MSSSRPLGLGTAVGNLAIEPGATTFSSISAGAYLLTYPGGHGAPEAARETGSAASDASTARGQADERPDKSIDAIATLKQILPSGAHFIQLGFWRGRILETRGSDFTAVLSDQVSNAPEETGTFQVGELSDDDVALISPGAEFYWVVGYQVSAARQRTRTSVIRMRRLPTYSSEEVERANDWVNSKSQLFEQNGSSSS